MISIHPYLNFPGNTAEAMNYYRDVFGGELTVLRFADLGVAGQPADGVMHAALKHPNFLIMASDAQPGAEQTWGGPRNYISVMGDELDVLRGWFDRLTADGTPGKPLTKEVWGDYYGDIRDRFGIDWMFNVSAA